MRKPAKTKDELIRNLTDVFRKSGFNGTTLSKLTEGTNLERASLYHYFPNGKNQMAEAILDHILFELNEKVLAKLKLSDLSSKERLTQMLEAANEFYDNGSVLCFITIFSIGELSTKISATIASAVEHWLGLLEQNFREQGLSSPQESARSALACIQGGLILSHVTKNKEIFKSCLDSLAKSWSRVH